MQDHVRDFATLFNMLWYRDFPIVAEGEERGSRAEWTTHIGICVRGAADLMGYFTRFEAGIRTDAVIKNVAGKAITNVEWEWTQPRHSGFNELRKLRDERSKAEFSVLITYSRDGEHHEENLRRIREAWSDCDEPLLLFLVRFESPRKREFGDLETYLIRHGKEELIRSQPALPWETTDKRWSRRVGDW